VGAAPNVTYEVLIPAENGEVEVDHLVIRVELRKRSDTNSG
jgi:hypothetical protein